MKKLLLLALSSLGIGAVTSCTDAPKPTSLFTPEVNLTPEQIEAGIFTADVMLKMGRLGATELSPDGSKILYTVTYFSVEENRGYSALWIMGADGQNPTQITDYSYSVGEPRWSADGSKIYFMSSKDGSSQIYSINPEGKELAKLSDVEGGVRGFEVSPDESKVWMAIEVQIQDVTSAQIFEDMPKSKALIYDDLMARHWDVWEDGKYSHVFVGELSGGKVQNIVDIMEGEPYDAPGAPYYGNGEVAWTSDSKSVAYTCRKLLGYQYAISTNTDIYLYNVDSKETKNLTEGMPGYDKYPRFSPDGRYMAWQSMARPGNESDKARLFVMELQSGQKHYVTEEFDFNASDLTWSADSKTIYFLSPIEATIQLCAAEVGSKDIRVITSGLHDYVSLSVVGDKIVAAKSTLSMAPEVFNVAIADGAETQLTAINKPIYDHIDMGSVEKRWVTTTDNKQMLVWVVTPPKAVLDGTTKYPALLYCQGGPQSTVSQFWSYRWNFQLMAAQGYVVVAPNRRGLPSFGQEWLDQISGDYSGQNIDDYFSAIDDVAKESYVDRENLGCVGASYGGYSVYYIAGKHEGRFKAFISHCGIFDFTSMYGSTEELWFVNNDYGGPYWDKSNKVAQRSYANSPHHFVQNWDTPILIIAGAKDYRIPYTQSLEAFTAARALDVDARLVVFEDEAHQVFGAQNALVWNREFFSWLDKYLK